MIDNILYGESIDKAKSSNIIGKGLWSCWEGVGWNVVFVFGGFEKSVWWGQGEG